MLYERDFPRLKVPESKLQIFKNLTREDHRQRKKAKYFQKFSDNFTLHGVCYIFYRHLYKFERYLWALCVSTAILSTVFICCELSKKYTDSAVITFVQDSQYPVFNVDFPAVAVCTKHRINWGRAELARKKFLPPDASNATVEVFMKFVKRLDTLEFRNFDNLAGLEDDPLHLIGSINVSKLAAYLAFRCDEIMDRECMWSYQRVDCCSLFVQERTTLGVCLVFNSIISTESAQKMESDKFYPYRTSKNGEGSGLIFTIKRNMSNVVPGSRHITGFELMIKKSDQWTDELTYHLRPNTNNGVVIQPASTLSHYNMRDLPISLRGCIYKEDMVRWYTIPGLEYRQWNCRTQCRSAYLIRSCNCTIPLFFRYATSKYRECTPSDYICVYKNRDLLGFGSLPNVEKYVKLFGRTMLCPCPRSCDSIDYTIALNTRPIQKIIGVNGLTRVDIYYQSEVMMKYVTKMKFTFLDLTAYFGGVIALLSGASIITSGELMHFALVKVVSYLRKKVRTKNTVRKINPRGT